MITAPPPGRTTAAVKCGPLAPRVDHPLAERADHTLREDVRRQLRASDYRPLWNVDCHVRQSRVILFGVVPSYYLKQVAQTVVLKMTEVTGVENRLRVDS